MSGFYGDATRLEATVQSTSFAVSLSWIPYARECPGSITYEVFMWCSDPVRAIGSDRIVYTGPDVRCRIGGLAPSSFYDVIQYMCTPILSHCSVSLKEILSYSVQIRKQGWSLRKNLTVGLVSLPRFGGSRECWKTLVTLRTPVVCFFSTSFFIIIFFLRK